MPYLFMLVNYQEIILTLDVVFLSSRIDFLSQALQNPLNYIKKKICKLFILRIKSMLYILISNLWKMGKKNYSSSVSGQSYLDAAFGNHDYKLD